jgi:hypothetical protein
MIGKSALRVPSLALRDILYIGLENKRDSAAMVRELTREIGPETELDLQHEHSLEVGPEEGIRCHREATSIDQS